MASSSPLNIIPRKFCETSQTAQYTASNCKTVIDKFTITNLSAGNVVFSTWLVPSGGSAANSNQVIQNQTITPGQCYEAFELVGQSLLPGGFIVCVSSGASALVLSATGREFT
jgi:hypothetical protein